MRIIVYVAGLIIIMVSYAEGQTGKTDKKKKETLAVLDFKSTQGMSQNDVITLTNTFRSSMAKTKSYEILERSDMESILKEQDMSLTDLCDNTDCAVQVGKLLVAKKMVIGEIGRIGDTYAITARIIDVTTGKVDHSENQQYKGKAEGLITVFDVLAQKLTGTYKRKSFSTVWAILGGAAVAGGGAAAYLILNKQKSASSNSMIDPPTLPGNP